MGECPHRFTERGMKMKKFLSMLCVGALALSLAACGSTANADYAGQTVAGQVTAIENSKLTLQLGELAEGGPGAAMSDGGNGGEQESGGQPPEKPDGEAGGSGEAGSSGSTESGSQPPEKPDSNSDGSEGAQARDGQSGDPGSDGSQPPEKPDGEQGSGGQPPEMPSGEAGGGMPGMFTAGEETITVDLSEADIEKNSADATLSDISEGNILKITFDDKGVAEKAEIVSAGGGFGGFGGSGEVNQGDSANTISEDGTYSDTSYTSTGDDENALRIDGANVSLDGITVDKSAGATSNTEDGDFYGMNAALLATNGATVDIKNATVTSSAQNGNGVFSYGSGTTVNISDSVITTAKDNSGGIQTTGGATTNASNLTVTTSGNSSAAIRSDRGGGTVDVSGGSYTSKGYNSPAVYSTADITVADATLAAENSEALVIEGKNSISLENCDVSGNMSDTKGASSDENVHNVMIYQSMSGDADVGTSEFSMTGGSLTGENGDMFYITNTHCVLSLSGVRIVNKDADGAFLRVVGNSASHGWGSAGGNGGDVEFTADSQTFEGDIIVDTISSLNMTLKNKSTFTGTINIVENAQGGAAAGNSAGSTQGGAAGGNSAGSTQGAAASTDNAVVTIEKGCTWNLTGDCTLTSLTNNGTINFNGYTITLADGSVLK